MGIKPAHCTLYQEVGSFIPRSHLERAYRELCDHEGWKAFSWMTIARALGTLTCRKLLKRNGVRFVAYRVSAPLTKSRRSTAAPDCPGIAPNNSGPIEVFGKVVGDVGFEPTTR